MFIWKRLVWLKGKARWIQLEYSRGLLAQISSEDCQSHRTSTFSFSESDSSCHLQRAVKKPDPKSHSFIIFYNNWFSVSMNPHCIMPLTIPSHVQPIGYWPLKALNLSWRCILHPQYWCPKKATGCHESAGTVHTTGFHRSVICKAELPCGLNTYVKSGQLIGFGKDDWHGRLTKISDLNQMQRIQSNSIKSLTTMMSKGNGSNGSARKLW
jgi:hypothetical protein